MSVVSRANSLLRRIGWLTPYAGGPLQAALSLVKFKRSPAAPQSFRFDGIPFQCRAADLQAVSEVLVDKEYAFLEQQLRGTASPVIVDAGTHIGTFALWALSIAPSAQILGIEADPETFAIAAGNAAAQRSRGAHWTVLHHAAGSSDGQIVKISQLGPSMSHRVSPDGTVPVQTISLARTLASLAPLETIDVLKVDIEGAEEDFLCAAPSLLGSVKTLVVELHPQSCDTDKVLRTLSSHYSTITEITGRTSNKPLVCCS